MAGGAQAAVDAAEDFGRLLRLGVVPEGERVLVGRLSRAGVSRSLARAHGIAAVLSVGLLAASGWLQCHAVLPCAVVFVTPCGNPYQTALYVITQHCCCTCTCCYTPAALRWVVWVSLTLYRLVL